MGKVDAHDVADGERPYNDGCPEEHPLVDGEERILRQQVLEERQVEGEGKLSRHTEQVAPDVSHLALPAVALVMMMMTAPAHPISTPSAFFQVIGSFNIRKERIMAKIGIEVVMMLELLGEVMFRPMV